MQFIVMFFVLWIGFQTCDNMKRQEREMDAWQFEQNRRAYRREVDRTFCRRTHPAYRNGCEM